MMTDSGSCIMTGFIFWSVNVIVKLLYVFGTISIGKYWFGANDIKDPIATFIGNEYITWGGFVIWLLIQLQDITNAFCGAMVGVWVERNDCVAVAV